MEKYERTEAGINDPQFKPQQKVLRVSEMDLGKKISMTLRDLDDLLHQAHRYGAMGSRGPGMWKTKLLREADQRHTKAQESNLTRVFGILV